MLKKKVFATITAVTRVCSNCGRVVTISPADNKTVCECGEVVYSAENNNDTSGENTHEKVEFEAEDNSTESSDSK